jgi:DNA-binding XRE family transcriptional regulator
MLSSDHKKNYSRCCRCRQHLPHRHPLRRSRYGKGSQALKQVLETYGISQNKLAVALEIDRSAVFNGYMTKREPSSETIVEITQALKTLNPLAAKEFVRLYLGVIVED